MSLFEHPEFDHHQHVSFFSDEKTGLRAIIAIHHTRQRFAGGGIRFFPYADSQQALSDVLRLSKSMTCKNILAGLPFGGGKSVIIGDPRVHKTEALLEAFGRCVEQLGGRYSCAEDIGLTPDDMAVINRSTSHVTGLPGKSGDTSPLTGYGVYQALRAAAHHRLGRPLESVAILGFGNVGRHLASHLARDGVKLFVADINADNVRLAIERHGATPLTTEALFASPVDAIAPCSIGAILNDDTIPLIQAPIICGGANNQLAHLVYHDRMLSRQGVLFVPDYIANAGGLISASAEVTGRPRETTVQMVEGIYDTCMRIFSLAGESACSPLAAAEGLAAKALRDESAAQQA